VEELYHGFDVFVLPSYREGFPRAAMEAAASAVPVIASDVRGCRQVVDDAVTGLLVPVGDAAALAAAIEELAGDGARRRAMGEAGRRKAVAEFDDRRVVATTMAVYERLLARYGRPL
jgi:glycosyltransferase involved in cell wall biosynthesis